jgi:hypothetical protein
MYSILIETGRDDTPELATLEDLIAILPDDKLNKLYHDIYVTLQERGYQHG